jgi:hypothetical protein
MGDSMTDDGKVFVLRGPLVVVALEAAIRRFPNDFSHLEIDLVIEIRDFFDGDGQFMGVFMGALPLVRNRACSCSSSVGTVAFAISAKRPERNAELYEDMATSSL